MKIQKYKAKITDSDKIVIGYITETRKYINKGCYEMDGTDYLISVTSKSMPNSEIRGTFLVDENTIEKVLFCPVCNKQEVKEKFNYSSCSKKCYDEL